MTGSGGNIWTGALAGYAASRAMDRATSLFYARQSETSKRREEELAPGGTLVQLGRELGRAAGRELTAEQAERVGVAVHRSLGVTYGIVASALVRGGARPLAAGLGVAATALVLVDEGTAISSFTAYSLESHLRGVVGHGTHGLFTGLVLSLAG